jgi:hypothetical protein
VSATFLDMAQELMQDAAAKAAFDADPTGFLAARGFDGLSPDDLTDAVGFVAETLPPETAQALADADADGDALARLAQVEPVVDEPADPDDATDLPGVDGFDDGDLLDRDDGTGEDDDGGEDDDEDEDDLGFATGAPDPTELPDEPDHAGFEPFRDDELGTGFGVGYENEDVDDASPPDAGELPHF